ncbi:MAG: hypothetical protein V1656_00760 [Candidatus Jorgensenbacteria bacterium]
MKKILLIAIVVLVAAAGIWYSADRGTFDGAPPVVRNEAGIRIPSPDAPIAVRAFNGTVRGVEGNVVRVSLNPPGGMTDASSWVYEREVVAGPDTKVYIRSMKDPAVYEKELAEFRKTYEGVSPQRYEDKEITPAELGIGSTLGIEAYDDVSREARFEAMTIRQL